MINGSPAIPRLIKHTVVVLLAAGALIGLILCEHPVWGAVAGVIVMAVGSKIKLVNREIVFENDIMRFSAGVFPSNHAELRSEEISSIIIKSERVTVNSLYRRFVDKNMINFVLKNGDVLKTEERWTYEQFEALKEFAVRNRIPHEGLE